MIRTLRDFVQSEYPNHDLRGDGDTRPLAAFTAVAEFRTADLAAGTTAHLREQFGAERVATVTATPPPTAAVRHGAEDSNSMAEVPKRRPLVGALGVGIVALVVVAAITLIAGGHIGIVVVCALFAAMLGAIEGAIIFGGARFAGEKAWDQQNLPEARIDVAAVFAESEHDAIEACKSFSSSGATSVRVVNESGAWHLPNLYTASE